MAKRYKEFWVCNEEKEPIVFFSQYDIEQYVRIFLLVSTYPVCNTNFACVFLLIITLHETKLILSFCKF